MKKFVGLSAGAGLWWLSAPIAQAQTVTTTTSTPSGSVLNLSGGGQLAFIAIVIGVLGALWFGITLYDRKTTSDWRTKNFAPLAEQILRYASPRENDPPMSTDEAKALATAVNTAPRGTPGLTRTLLALGLLALVGVALVTLVVGDGSKASDLLKTVVTALTGALTTILGFYFGAKASTDSTTTPASGSASTTTAAASSASNPKPTLPDAPPKPRATATGQVGEVKVDFDAPPSDGGAAISSYTVTAYRDGKPVVYVTKPMIAPTAITLMGMDSGDEHTFTVHAANQVGAGKESPMSDGATPE